MRETNFRENKSHEEEETSKQDVEYDQLLIEAGEFGPYQILVFFKSCPFYIFGAIAYFQQLFLTQLPENYWCRIPELGNMSEIERRLMSIPMDKDSPVGYSQCTAYVANWTEVLLTGNKPNESWPTQNCQYGWEFNTTEIPYPTISSDLGWVCDKSSYQATAQSLFCVGSIIGGFLIGWISDRFGRIPAVVIANIIACVAGIASTFARNFVEFTVCRIIMGMSYDNCMMMSFLLLLEYVAPKYRTMMANLSFAAFYTIGVTALPWIAIACGHWKTISIVTSVPFALALLTPFVLPESPRWLITRGRLDDVIGNIKAIAYKNNKVVPEKTIQQFKISCEKNKQEKYISLLELMKRPKLRIMFLCLCFEYFSCIFVYDALVRSLGSLKFDFFISFTVTSFTELPSLVLLSFTSDVIGRKWLSIIVLIICAVFSFMIPIVGGGLPAVVCAVIARFACNMACNSMLQWQAELLPTSVRGSGTSVTHICGYLGTFVAPFVTYLNIYASWISMVVVGVISLVSTAICFYLPETAQKNLPQTLEELEHMIKNRKVWEMPCMQKNQLNNSKNVGRINDSFKMT